MKKNLFMVAAVALMALVSCSKENFNDNGVQGETSDIVFVAESDATKTALGTTTDGITAVNWVGNEKININGVEFSTTSTGARAEFTTTSVFDETAATFDAIYPSTAGTSLSAVTIPASQDGTFANAAISVATSTTTSLHFKNVASILKFQVPVNASTVTISSESNLAGTVSVTFGEDGLPVIGTVTGASKEIKAEAAGGFKTGIDYYVAVLPGSHKLTVKIDGFTSYASSKTPEFARAGIKTVGILPAPNPAAISINNMNGWGDLKITVKSGTTTLAHQQLMTDEGNNVFVYKLDEQYIGQSVTYYIEHSWYQTSTKTITLSAYSATTPIDLNTTYLEPGTWDWGSATFGAWLWGNGVDGFMVTATKVKDNFFEVEIPTDKKCTSVIFVRCDKDNAVASWDTKWNQTEDLTLKHMCYCVNTWEQADLTDKQWF